MKKVALGTAIAAILIASACQNTKDKNNDPQALSAKAIEIHDKIMPQISLFDKHTILVDSLLGNMATVKSAIPSLDTAVAKKELTTLKTDLESSTDNMMVWMKDYMPDSTDVAYQKAEVDRITELQSAFDKVTKDADRILSPFNK